MNKHWTTIYDFSHSGREVFHGCFKVWSGVSLTLAANNRHARYIKIDLNAPWPGSACGCGIVGLMRKRRQWVVGATVGGHSRTVTAPAWAGFGSSAARRLG